MKFSPKLPKLNVRTRDQKRNTNEKGLIEFTIFEESGGYVGVCLTFDIVVEGNDYEQVRKELLEAAQLHLETVYKHELPEDLLNRPAPQEYWDRREQNLQSARKLHTTGSERHSYSKDRVLQSAGAVTA